MRTSQQKLLKWKNKEKRRLKKEPTQNRLGIQELWDIQKEEHTHNGKIRRRREERTEGIFEGQITVRHQSTDPGRTENTKQHT